MAERRRASTKKKSARKTQASGKINVRGSKTARATKKTLAPTSAYFLSLTIENVRCFGPRQTLDLSDRKGRPAQWTIILGNNGVGKTTLLQSLVAVTPSLSARSDEKAFVAPLYEVGAKLFSTWNAIRHEVGNEPLFISADFVTGITLTNDSSGEVIKDFFVEENLSGILGQEVLSRARGASYEKLGNLPCFGYGASRRMGQTSLSEKTEDDPFNSLFSDDAALINAEEWLLQADYAARAATGAATRKRAGKRRDDIRKILNRLLPDAEEIRFTQLTKEQLRPGVEVKTPYGWVSIKDLSLGYKTLVAWMVDFASRMFDRYPDSRDPLAEPAVVLVDEIDLHLHPKWQRELIRFLSELFPNTQFIATTNSPLVVQSAQGANLVVLRREGDHVLIDNEVESVEGWRVDQILTGEPFELESARAPQFDALLGARREILSKSRLTTKDRTRLRAIESEVGELPAGETPEEMKALDIIARAAARLGKKP